MEQKLQMLAGLFFCKKNLYILGPISSFRSAAEKLAEAIFEPKKILHKRSAEAFFRGKNRWEPIFLLQI